MESLSTALPVARKASRKDRKASARPSDAEIAVLREARRVKREEPVDGLAAACMGGLKFAFSGGLELAVEDELGIEGMQWPGGVRLARYLDEAFSGEYWAAATVVELGAGRGLTSCVASALGCPRVYCTDMIIEHAAATVALNGTAMAGRAGAAYAPPAVSVLAWGATDPPTEGATLVLCGDCMYEPAMAEALIDGILAVAIDPDCEVLVCGAVGEPTRRRFEELAVRFFDVELLEGNARRGDRVTTWPLRALLRLTRKAAPPPLRAVAPAVKVALAAENAEAFDGIALEVRRHAVDATPPDLVAALRRTLGISGGASGGGLLGNRVAVLDGVLSEEECAALVAALDACPARTFWADEGGDGDGEPRAFRDADTVEAPCGRLARAVYKRCRAALFPEARARETAADGERVETRGAWAPACLNDDFLFATYPDSPTAGFAPHSDGAATRGLNARSFFSVIVYLNGPPKGGGTRFYEPDAAKGGLERDGGRWTARRDLLVGEVAPKAGRALVFDQRLVHEGVPPAGDRKHIIRSDVLFDRVDPLFDSPGDRAAFADYERAVGLSEKGDHAAAVTLFTRVARASPALAAELGI